MKRMRHLWAAALAASCLSLAFAQDSRPAAPPAESTKSADDSRRTPKQLDLLRELLRERERPAPIIPSRERIASQQPRAQRRAVPGLEARDPRLLPDGAMIVERPARLIVDDARPRLMITIAGETEPRTMEVNRNEWLEAMERAGSSGIGEFVITGEVSLYRGANFILLRKVLERLDNGNLTP